MEGKCGSEYLLKSVSNIDFNPKGTYDLVRAVKVIIDEYKINNVSLKIAGNGEEGKCKKYVKKLKLENKY